MSGESTDSLYRNVIEDFIRILGPTKAKYIQSAKGGPQFIIKNGKEEKVCYCRGTAKANNEADIRGLTIGGWYADEVTLHHETFVKQAINRMSLEGARAFWTTNPDNPFHFIKVEFMDKAKEKGYKLWHFTLDDNLTLSEEYKENLKKAYSGLWYKRFIEGLWILAEGVIYDMFSKEEHVISAAPRGFERYIIGVDYGTGNPTVFLKIGILKGNYYVLDEYYYSGRETGFQKTDGEYADDFQKFIKGLSGYTIYIDPSAASFIVELKKRGIKVKKANNSVLDGIRTVGNLLSRGKLFVLQNCKRTIEEFSVYSWDPKAAQKGEDKPLKEHDHAMDALRYAVFSEVDKKTVRYGKIYV